MFVAGDRAGLLPQGNPSLRRPDDRFFGASVNMSVTDYGGTEGREESIYPGAP